MRDNVLPLDHLLSDGAEDEKSELIDTGKLIQ
jgi:hypothetical protein